MGGGFGLAATRYSLHGYHQLLFIPAPASSFCTLAAKYLRAYGQSIEETGVPDYNAIAVSFVRQHSKAIWPTVDRPHLNTTASEADIKFWKTGCSRSRFGQEGPIYLLDTCMSSARVGNWRASHGGQNPSDDENVARSKLVIVIENYLQFLRQHVRGSGWPSQIDKEEDELIKSIVEYEAQRTTADTDARNDWSAMLRQHNPNASMVYGRSMEASSAAAISSPMIAGARIQNESLPPRGNFTIPSNTKRLEAIPLPTTQHHSAHNFNPNGNAHYSQNFNTTPTVATRISPMDGVPRAPRLPEAMDLDTEVPLLQQTHQHKPWPKTSVFTHPVLHVPPVVIPLDLPPYMAAIERGVLATQLKETGGMGGLPRT